MSQSSSFIPQKSPEDLVSKVCQSFRQQVFFKDLGSLFVHTLSRNPGNRDLSAVIKLLEDEKSTEIIKYERSI